MSLSGDARAQAAYDAVAQQGNFGMLNASEKGRVLTQLKAFFAADTSYLTENAAIVPGALANNAGQAVQVSPLTGTGTTVAPQTLIGTGNLT